MKMEVNVVSDVSGTISNAYVSTNSHVSVDISALVNILHQFLDIFAKFSDRGKVFESITTQCHRALLVSTIQQVGRKAHLEASAHILRWQLRLANLQYQIFTIFTIFTLFTIFTIFTLFTIFTTLKLPHISSVGGN